MKKFSLTAEEIQELRAAHAEALKRKDGKSAYKINAVILLGSGWTCVEASEALLLDDETIRNYRSIYQKDGVAGLVEKKYKGSEPKLTEEQQELLSEELDSNVYLTTAEVCQYVDSTFGESYTVSGMRDLLHRLGYVYKKPKLVPSNPDTEAQEVFLKQYVEFMENKAKNEAVFFVDAVHAVHNSLAGYGWIKKGKEKELKSNTGRSRLNIHGAMNAETLETTVVTGENNVNAESTIQLFEYLETLYPLAVTIYVILDNAKYHFSWEVQEWLRNSRIKLVFLPPYSPQLNLIERLWKIFKKKILRNQFYESFSDFKKACKDFFENQADYYEEIQSIMGDGLEGLTL